MTVAVSRREADLDPALLQKAIRAVFSAPGYRPPMLPGVAAELMQLAGKPSVDFEEVVKLLERDPVLTGKVLSIAQSALYTGRSPIKSLRQALVRLGLATLRDLVLEASVNLRVFRVPGYERPMEVLGRHSTAVAHVMRLVCGRTRIPAEHAFLCGLLHDVGIVASLLALSGSPRWRGARFDLVAPALHEVHAEASGLLATVWGLPEPIRLALRTHHAVVVDDEPHPVNAALVVAEQLVWEAGCGNLPPPVGASATMDLMPEPPAGGLDTNPTRLVAEAQALLRLEDGALRELRAESWEVLRKVGLLESSPDA